MTWLKGKVALPVGHEVATQHKFSVAGMELVTREDDINRGRLSKDSSGRRCPNAITLDRSEIDTLIDLLIAWRDVP